MVKVSIFSLPSTFIAEELFLLFYVEKSNLDKPLIYFSDEILKSSLYLGCCGSADDLQLLSFGVILSRKGSNTVCS